MPNHLATTAELAPLIALVTNGLTSPASRRAYARNLSAFMDWRKGEGQPPIDKALVNAYRAHLLAEGKAAATVNQALAAIRKLATEAADNGYIEHATAAAIGRVKGVSVKGTRVGNWLTKEQAQALIHAPELSTLKGQRDRAIFAVMLGAGLRRAEVVALEFSHIQQREGRWVIIDLKGKGGRVRSVPIASWVKVAIDEWQAAAGLTGGYVFLAIGKGGRLTDRPLSTQAIYKIVAEYTPTAGIAPHDLRRTFAQLARKGGAALEQIQLSLGHASIITTERYLGTSQDLATAPADVLGLMLR